MATYMSNKDFRMFYDVRPFAREILLTSYKFVARPHSLYWCRSCNVWKEKERERKVMCTRIC